VIFCGVDPGKKGSVSFIDGRGKFISVTPTPMTEDDYDEVAMFELLQSHPDVALVVLERSQAFPGQGVVSMFSFGVGYGLWKMAIKVSKIPFQIVHPRVWTRALLLGASGEGKDRNYSVARQLFPDWQPKLKKEHEYCDSLLLAEYGRRAIVSQNSTGAIT